MLTTKDIAKHLLKCDKVKSLAVAEQAIETADLSDSDGIVGEICAVFCLLAQELGDPNAARVFTVNGFKKDPTVENYQRVRMTVDPASWLSVKDEMITFLRALPPTLKNNKAKLQIYLSEG
jgi:hypothetical protein